MTDQLESKDKAPVSKPKPSSPGKTVKPSARPGENLARPSSSARPGNPPSQTGSQPSRPGSSPRPAVTARPEGARPAGPPQKPSGAPQRPASPPSRPTGTSKPTGAAGQSAGHGARPPAPRPGSAPNRGPAQPSKPGNGRPGGHSGQASRPGGQAPRPGAPGRPAQTKPASRPQPIPDAEPVRPAPSAPTIIELPASITVRDLAPKLRVTPIDIIKKLMSNGVMANINQPIDLDTATLVAGEFGFEVREEKPVEVEAPPVTLTSIPKRHTYTEAELAHLVLRPPVVTVMGHVDHGKTSLLDAIRHANVVAGEFGGITQHIGAYQVVHNNKKITFLDTPGHEAFTAMRARGAKATDLAIIVVAADDGVMPQTREAIDHARAAQVPILIALNKIDKANAQPERVKQQLSDLGLAVYGGKDEVTVVPVSAKQKVGITDLLENILLVSELADLRADPNSPARGVIIESKLDKQQGPMATLLVQNGTLHVGDVVLSGEVFGKVRAMFNERSEPIEAAPPSTPVQVTGLSGMPDAGQEFQVVEAEQIARYRANERAAARKVAAEPRAAVNLNDLFAQFQQGKVQQLNLVVKADVAGSLEPIVSSLEKLGDEKLKIKILHQGIGTVTRSDVMLAAASQAIIIAFNVGVEAAAEAQAEQEKIDLRHYNIIYKLIEDVDKALKGMLEPVYKDVLAGRFQVLQLFHVKKATIAGGRVIEGQALRNATARVLRGGQEIFKGSVASLKRYTEDVKEVATGYECGLALEGFSALQVDDLVEFYKRERVS